MAMKQLTTWYSNSLALVLFAVLLAVPATCMSLNVEGAQYPDTVTIAGKTLKLVGAGLREKWMIDVYSMGAYSESASCDTSVQMKNNETRYMLINMLRTVSAKKIADAFREAFENNTPPDASKELKENIAMSISWFKQEATKGSTYEFIYNPSEGMIFMQNGKKLGLTIKGKDFADVVWNCYFSDKTCCKGLKKDILKTCKDK
jgi:hypothetical protein